MPRSANALDALLLDPLDLLLDLRGVRLVPGVAAIRPRDRERRTLLEGHGLGHVQCATNDFIRQERAGIRLALAVHVDGFAHRLFGCCHRLLGR
jgi:hypothetical protein